VRYEQLCGLDTALADNHYAGLYITELARSIFDAEGTRWAQAPETSEAPETPETNKAAPQEAREAWQEERRRYFREFGYAHMLRYMKDICEGLGVHFDVWYSERDLYAHDSKTGVSPVEAMLAELDAKGYLYEKDNARWFRSTALGDDKDRVLVKSDGSYTYFAPDIAYHINKFNRGSDHLINIWGADHHGYIPRMQAACTALGHEGKLKVVLGQLVNLFRNGEVVRMSKRSGELVTFEELVEEVGADATKYLMLARSSDQALDFDIELAKKQDSSNPVYYVQYAHARICSLLRKAAEQGIELEHLIQQGRVDLSLLQEPTELELARVFARLAEVVEGCARDLAPFRLTHYAEELATTFHRFYTECHVISDDADLSAARLYLADATRNVLAVTLGLLGVSAPERM
jgi:arginyl-tRNA synthetase